MLHHHAAKGGGAGHELVMHVHTHHGKSATDPTAKHGKTVKIAASGSVLKELHELAKAHAHVKVTGTLSGDVMNVTAVSETHHKPKA